MSIVYTDEAEAHGVLRRSPVVSDRFIVGAAVFGLGLVSLAWIVELWPAGDVNVTPRVAALSETADDEIATALPPQDLIPMDVEPETRPTPANEEPVVPPPVTPNPRAAVGVPAPGVPLPPRRPNFAEETEEPRAPEGIPLPPRRPDRKSTRLNSSHIPLSRMPSSA